MRTHEDLKSLQDLPLDWKVRESKARIAQWLVKMPSYLSFSGGKDSTVLRTLIQHTVEEWNARNALPLEMPPAVFIDTGLEYPEVRDFAKKGAV